MTGDPVRAIADAVLYEGYILWPYRRSALKNQQRFQFGGVYPPAHAAAHPDDRSRAETEVLLRAGGTASVDVEVRFLQVVRRTVSALRDGEPVDVNELRVGDERHQSWEEAVERAIAVGAPAVGELAGGRVTAIDIPAGERREILHGPDGAVVGAVTHRWQAIRGAVEVSAVAAGERLWRVTARIANTTVQAPVGRPGVLHHALCSTHALLHAPEGAFVSAADPPPELAAAAGRCRNVGLWPVLVGEPEDATTMLASPIILEDHPRVAPESPGDLFDGGEIDQLLILNILALTDEEKAEMAAADPRAREILRRSEGLSPEQLMALHGTVRELGLVRR